MNPEQELRVGNMLVSEKCGKNAQSHSQKSQFLSKSRYTKRTQRGSTDLEEDEEEDEFDTGTPSSVTLKGRLHDNFRSYTSAVKNLPTNSNLHHHDVDQVNQGRHQSKELFSIHQHPPQLSSSTAQTTGEVVLSDERQSKSKLCIASTLVVSYLIEVGIQVFFIIQCCRLLQSRFATTDFELMRMNEQDATKSTLYPWSWFLIASSVLSSFLVTFMSFKWVFRGMDFSDRLCGRLLCYVMHSFLLGILWRYLKLAFAYDKADLEEFFKLKTIQAYIQSLPLVTIHLAWVLTTQQQYTFPEYPVDSYHVLSSWLVVAEMLCTVMSFLLLSASTTSIVPSSTSTCNSNNNGHNLREIVIVPSDSSLSRGKSNKGFKYDNSFSTSDNNPNHHFNDSGTASSLGDNHNQQQNHCEIGEEQQKKSFCTCTRLKTAVKWLLVNRYSPNRRNLREIGRALLLLSRLISLGMLVYKMNYYWTGFIILLHLTVSYVWLACWALVGNTGTRRNKVAMDNNCKMNSPHKNESSIQSDYCETKSSKSNDSGLVKSEVVVKQNGFPVSPQHNHDDNNAPTHEPVCSNEDYDSVNGCARGHHPHHQHQQHPVDFKSFMALSNCIGRVIVHKNNRRRNSGNAHQEFNKGEQQLKSRGILTISRVVLPVAYVLFWDLNFKPAASVFGRRRVNLCATALPVLFVTVENICIVVYYLLWKNVGGGENISLALASVACLLLVFGWIFMAAYHFQLREHHKSQKVHAQEVEHDIDPDVDDDSSGHKWKARYGGDSGLSSLKSSPNSRKETGECLSLCCSSLSHPLNIKRKGHRDQPQPKNDSISQDNNFGKNGTTKKRSINSPSSDPISTCMKNFNEYEEQQEVGKLTNSHIHHHHQRGSEAPLFNLHHNSNDHTGNKKGVTKFPDLGLPSHHSGVSVRGEEGTEQINKKGGKDKVINYQRSAYQENGNSNLMLMAQGDVTPGTPTPVTNNYTNVKEALTRRISNKSCSSSKKHQERHSHSHQQHDKAMNQDDCESVKGGVKEGIVDVEGKGMISSFKSSSSSSTRHHKVQKQQPPPPPSNSNKCMPISIKSPISWLPESCCNDSSLGSGSSNSRNTNTLVTTTTSSKLLYCPEKYIDLDNNNIEKAEKRTVNSTSRHEQRHDHHQQHHHHQNSPDFSIVFFEGRGGSCGRSYKQKQSRTPVASSALLGRTARSANATPVASSKSQSERMRTPTYLEYNNVVAHEDCDDDEPVVGQTRARLEGRSARLRNQITGKTYLSDGASLTSLDGLCEIRASTPVEIKKASRVIVNYPPPHHQISDSKTVSRCLCKVESSPLQNRNNSKKFILRQKHQVREEVSGDDDDEDEEEAEIRIAQESGSCIINNNNNIYEKLIDDSYGILICEGEHGQNAENSNCIVIANDYPHHNHPSIRLTDCRSGGAAAGGNVLSTGLVSNQKLRILCAKCLENHDPLLTNCLDSLPDYPKVVDHYAPNAVVNASLMASKNLHVKSLPHLVSYSPHVYDPAESDTTDYPSDTELTTTMNNNALEDDGQSLSTHFSSATYTWHQHQHHHHNHHQHNNYSHHYQQPTQLSQFIWTASQMMPTTTGSSEATPEQQTRCSKEFTGLEYVRTWLLASHPRTVAAQTMNHNNHHQDTSDNGPSVNNTHQQHPQYNRPRHYLRQHENSICRENKDDNRRKIDKRVLAMSSTTTTSPQYSNVNYSIPFKNKSSWHDNKISKKKRFRHLEKRQRPIGRGASPPVKEFCTENSNSNSSNHNNPTQVENDVPIAILATTAPTAATNTCTTTNNNNVSSAGETRFQPPPSRKQHPLLFYDMMPRQEEQKPLTATNTSSHKKCRDQLDLFHKELETVV